MAAALWWGSPVHAQSDPVIMTVNNKPVLRSEFEYSYNKNNNAGVIDRKSVKEYVDLFINYKLKVEAALDAKLDTMESFRKEFETQAYALEKGQMSRPFESPAGWHIILMKDRRMCMPYDTLRASILQFVERRGMVEAIINQRIDSIARQQGSKVSHEEVLTARMKELEAKQPELRYLIQEYHDGLLLFEMSNRTVWEKAQNDKEGQENYFKANRKRYKWTEPHYKGIAYHTRTKADIAAVKKAVKGLPFDKWAERLRTTFNNDSILRIRVEKGIFVKGDNKTIDRLVFKTGDEAKPNKDFPFDAVYGKKLKAPNEAADVNALVVADYQEYLEEKWVGELRKRYTFTVNEDVVNTVNKH